jgi:hypothetical protein
MEKHFMGRYGADPGAYEMPGKLGKESLSASRKISINKSDRGLLPLDKEQIKSRSKLYNYSNMHVGPASYGGN